MSARGNATTITRAKIVGSRVGPRTLLQVTGLDGEVFSNIELLLPPGYVANPLPGGDIVLAEATGVRGHVVGLAGDNTADTVADLQPGEFGLSHNGKSVIFRLNSITVIDPQAIILQAPSLQWTPDGVTFYELATAAHTHPVDGDVTLIPNTGTGMLT